MGYWRAINRLAYWLYYRQRHRHVRRLGREATAWADRGAPAERPRVLLLAWGRIGDAVLATGYLRHLRALFGDARVVAVARPETFPILAPHVDELIGFAEAEWHVSARARRDLVERLGGGWTCVLTDLHFFYGGVQALGGLLAALPAARRFAYAGYTDSPGLAPGTRFPAGVEVIDAPVKPSSDLDGRHLLHDGAHYLTELSRRLGVAPAEPFDTRPLLAREPSDALAAKYGDAIAWQPRANNPRKDVPLATWKRVVDAFPHRTFIALGTREARHAVIGFGARNVVNLCGETPLDQALDIIAASAGFLGPDSGLTHAAACLGKPSVCVTTSSNLGYFFPYPASYGFANLETVDHPAFRRCSGCFMTCAHEPIWRTAKRGALCVRDMPAELIIEAVRLRLDAPSHTPVV